MQTLTNNREIESPTEPMPPLFVSAWRENAYLFLQLRGELDMHTVGVLKQAINNGLTDLDCAAIVVDMSAVSFIDSTGYGTFISAMQTLRLRGGGGVHLAACQPSVARMLAVIRLNRVFTMHKSVEDARESLSVTRH
ncbi:MAG: STAS domain-containing protein [Armatimonadetes bacterium]|nr:STAS domain-containing protein [Armatimonadota bacterium]